VKEGAAKWYWRLCATGIRDRSHVEFVVTPFHWNILCILVGSKAAISTAQPLNEAKQITLLFFAVLISIKC
jgi:nitrate reductase gamma subunit